MADIKLHNPQPQIPAGQLTERFKLIRLYVSLTRASYELAFPEKMGFGGDLETLLVLMGVFLGDAEGRPTTVTKIASYCGLPRATVYRRLEDLIKLKKVVRTGRKYYFAEGAVTPDRHRKLERIIEEFCDK